jgi:hypothetical protein
MTVRKVSVKVSFSPNSGHRQTLMLSEEQNPDAGLLEIPAGFGSDPRFTVPALIQLGVEYDEALNKAFEDVNEWFFAGVVELDEFDIFRANQ